MMPVSADTALVWLSLAGTSIMAIIMAFPKVAGSATTTVETVVSSARRTSTTKEAADIAAMQRQIAYLQEQVFELQKHKDIRDDFIIELQRWAFTARSSAALAGINLPEPPKLHLELLEDNPPNEEKK